MQTVQSAHPIINSSGSGKLSAVMGGYAACDELLSLRNGSGMKNRHDHSQSMPVSSIFPGLRCCSAAYRASPPFFGHKKAAPARNHRTEAAKIM